MPNVEPSDVQAINAMSRAAFDQLLASVDRLIRSTPVLSDFVRWDGGYTQAHVPPLAIPAIERIQRMSAAESASTAPVAAAVRAVAQQAHWQQTYREDEVGKDFLERYGWFELVGPFGHFHDDMLRAYLAYWGDHLNYPWHLHEAEELYFILAGGAAFEAEGLSDTRTKPPSPPQSTTRHDNGGRTGSGAHPLAWGRAGWQRKTEPGLKYLADDLQNLSCAISTETLSAAAFSALHAGIFA